MFKLSHINIEKYRRLYNSRYKLWGYSPKTLGWYTGKQNIRYHIVSKDWGNDICSVLDVGCGFADLYVYISEKGMDIQYTGIDLNINIMEEGRRNILKCGWSVPQLVEGDFLDYIFSRKYDAVVAIGISSLYLTDQDNYQYIEAVIEKGYKMANSVFVMDFCTKRFTSSPSIYGFEYEPAKILEIARKFTDRISLLCDYFPTEFMIKMYKDCSYNDSYIYNNNIYIRNL